MKKILYLSAPEDSAHLSQLDIFLAPILENKLGELLNHSNSIENNQTEMLRQVEIADLVLCLLSPNFLNSGFLMNTLAKKVFQRMNLGQCEVVSLMLQPCNLDDSEFSEIENVPENGKAILGKYWIGRRSEAWVGVASGVLKYFKSDRNISAQKIKEVEEEIQNLLLTEREINEARSKGKPFEFDDESWELRDYENLRRYGPDIFEMMRGSSFDTATNLDGKLSWMLFKKRLLARTQEIEAFSQEMKILIESNINHHARIIFLTGYPGTGKTTFVRMFMEENSDDYDFVLYDLEGVNVKSALTSGLEQEKSTERSVLDVFAQTMARDEERLVDSFKLLIMHKKQLFTTTFISPAFLQKLEELELKMKTNPLGFIEVFTVLRELDYADTFTAFFIHHLNADCSKKRKVIVFDNLDVIRMEHLGRHFFKAFSLSLWNANNLAQSGLFVHKDIEFTRRFKFVFCMREASYECINPHVDPRMKQVAEIQLRFKQETHFFREIVERRLRLYKDLIDAKPGQLKNFYVIRRWFDAFLEDEYFNRVFVPLYNKDFRNSVSTLLNIVHQPLTHQIDPDLITFKSPRRGILFFYLIKELKIKNFLSDYVLWPGSDSGAQSGEVRANCYLDRMLLIVLLNFSQIDGLDDIEHAQVVSLVDVLDELNIAYSREEVLTSIAKCFLYHRNNWSHLLTIKDTDVSNELTFQKDFLQLLKSNKPAAKKVQIRINPAGYIFLRHIMPHFEFYNVLAGGKCSLYEARLVKSVDESKERMLVFDFEKILETVLQWTKMHIQAMALFYNAHFQPHMTTDGYRASRFTFKHFGGGGPKQKGYFHSTRIITTHISYIDNYRQFLLHDKREIPKITTKQELNRILCGYLEQFVQLLKNTIDDRAIKSFSPGFEANLNLIKAADYLDFDTLILARELS